MKLIELRKILASKKDLLVLAGIRAVYLYGSQVEYVKSKGILPIGKEVDLVFIKNGSLKDGEPPISHSLAVSIFADTPNVIISFNGVWSNCQFKQKKYYLDILGEGLDNIKSEYPSSKIVALNKKINIWGGELKEFENYTISLFLQMKLNFH